MTGTTANQSAEANLAVYRLVPDENRAQSRVQALPDSPEWIEPLLHQNAVWFCRLRWLVIAVLTGAGLAGFLPGSLEKVGLAVRPAPPLGAAALLASLNLLFVAGTHPSALPRKGFPVRLLLWGQIVSDLLVLTAVIHWLGHQVGPAPFMYLFHVILACIVFTPGESLAVVVLAAAFYLSSLLLESWGVLGLASVILPAGNGAGLLTGVPSSFSVIPMLLIWSVIWYLVSRLASAFRSRDRELFISNRRLRASIEERSQHMLQTTHQLKAPFAAIHAQSQLLLGEYCGELPAPAKVAVERISARCLVLARQIQEMLQLANLRSQGQTAPPTREVNVATLIEEVINRVEPAARERGIRFEKEIQPVTVEAVEDHLTMLMDNLLVNAVNYSYAKGVVNVSCRGQEAGGAVIVVRDQGIGIAKEKLARIFDDYYRTEEAVQHNRASTGLGLAIVRQVACKDRVPITVESAPGWGTRFTVVLPRSPAAPLQQSANINN